MFKTKITFGSVTSGTTAKGVPYKTAKGSVMTKKDGSTREITVMAFGDQLAEIKNVFRKGRTADLTVVFDGATLKAIGFPRAKQPAADVAAAA